MASKEVIFCRICLSVNLTKKYYLRDTLEREFIERIFKNNGYYMDLNDRSYVCCECRISLHKSYKFTQKALKAQNLFYKYMLPLESLTHFTLASVDREQNGISTDLMYSGIEIHDVKPFKTENNGDCNDSIKVEEDDINENDDPLVQDNCNIIYDVKVEKDPIADIPLDAPCKEVANSAGVLPNGVCDVKDDSIRVKIGESTNAIEFLVDDGANVLDSHDANEEKESKYIDPYTGELVRMDQNSKEIKLNDYSDETIFLSDSSSGSDIDLKTVKRKKSLLKELYDFEISDSLHLERPKRKKYNFVTEEIVEHDVNNVSADPDVSNIIEGRFRNKKRVSYKGLDLVWKKEDEEFVPSASDVDDSADDSCDGFNDRGRPVKPKDKRTFPMTCEQCEAIICSKAEHAYHYSLMHKDKEYPYANLKTCLCPNCGKYLLKAKVAAHMLKHTGDKPACHICNKKYSSRAHMLAHISRVHEKRLCFTCDYCKKKFWSKEDLKIHLRSHTGEKPFKCHLCDYRCAHKGNLRPHIKHFHQKMEITKKAVGKDKEKGTEKNTKSRAKNGEKKKRRRRKVVTSCDSE